MFVRAENVLRRRLARCETCGRLTGEIEERYNGTVAVRCRCQLAALRGPLKRNPRGTRSRWGSPSIVSLLDDSLMWTPISDAKHADGRWWHQPYFAGWLYNKKKPRKYVSGA